MLSTYDITFVALVFEIIHLFENKMCFVFPFYIATQPNCLHTYQSMFKICDCCLQNNTLVFISGENLPHLSLYIPALPSCLHNGQHCILRVTIVGIAWGSLNMEVVLKGFDILLNVNTMFRQCSVVL